MISTSFSRRKSESLSFKMKERKMMTRLTSIKSKRTRSLRARSHPKSTIIYSQCPCGPSRPKRLKSLPSPWTRRRTTTITSQQLISTNFGKLIWMPFFWQSRNKKSSMRKIDLLTKEWVNLRKKVAEAKQLRLLQSRKLSRRRLRINLLQR